MKKLAVSLFAAAVMIAQAAQSHTVRLFQPSIIAGETLKPGEYRMVLDGSTLTVQQRGKKIQAEVSVQEGEKKFASTSVRYENGDGNYKLKEIRLGGTNKIVTLN
ncbi:MAG: hypothetical protein U0Q16_08440 [Bryobacteraceae bacterium]